MATQSTWFNIFVLVYFAFLSCILSSEQSHCEFGDGCQSSNHEKDKYNKNENEPSKWENQLQIIKESIEDHAKDNSCPAGDENCACHKSVIDRDLWTWQKSGITQDILDAGRSHGTTYQIINHMLYREKKCMFPARCLGVEHFILEMINDLPDMEFILNSHDYPKVAVHNKNPTPVFSFSKDSHYLDIMYPAWTFWEGGPAISLYPTGIGRWDLHRDSINKAREKYPWDAKLSKAFFRGSRTSSERDPLVLMSRDHPDVVDAQYTKNQAWKSDKDTLGMPAASEISFEDHCQYKYVFNFRGVAASFRYKHLFLCGSLVFQVGDEWHEFFYPALTPWMHYIPVSTDLSDAWELIQFARENNDVVKEIANRGRQFIWDHLRMDDVKCFWKQLLIRYAQLLKFKPKRNKDYAKYN